VARLSGGMPMQAVLRALAALAVAVPFSALAHDASTMLAATAYAAEAVQKKLSAATHFHNLVAYEPAARVLVVCGEVDAKGGIERFVWLPLGPDREANLRNGTAFIGADEIGDKWDHCRNSR
jgi:hypothetical protein